MTTRAQLRTSIRLELNDSGGTPLWSDSLLNEWINQAIRAYSRELPEEATATITAVADQASYALPARTQRVLRVEQPADVVRVRISASRTSPGDLIDLVDFQTGTKSAGAWGYRVFASNLLLDPVPTSTGLDQDIQLEYLRSYAEPTADGDTLATPSSDDEVLICLAAALALTWVGSDEAKRLRYGDARGPSPAALATDYRHRAEAVLALKRNQLRTTTLEVL